MGLSCIIVAPQAQFQSVGVWDVVPRRCPRGMCVRGVVLFDELDLRTPAYDFFKIEDLACHWTV